jgi:NAD(P)H-hydrate epimerase
MSDLPPTLYTATQVRQFDRAVIQKHGIDGFTLMTRAAEAAHDVLVERWPKAHKIAVACGIGNNAGDGFVLARLAQSLGRFATVVAVGDVTRLQDDALQAFEFLQDSGVVVCEFGPGCFDEADIIVDALFGTGLDREATGRFAEAIAAINAAGRPVLAIDIPSGLNADTGAVWGTAVRADVTVTFIGLKRGLFTAAGPEHAGLVRFSDLKVPAAVFAEAVAAARRLDGRDLKAALPPRRRSAHKGDFGHVLVVGGDRGMAGAARLAAEAALRVGAGLVSIATHPSHAGDLLAGRPEIMCRGVEGPADIDALLTHATVVAVGPGLGTRPGGRGLVDAVLSSSLPLIVDADALNLLSERPIARKNWILTPHPGEAGRLLGVSAKIIQSDRFRAAAELCKSYGGTIVLKGCGTIVHDATGPVGVCPYGNPGMASAGMGDVLTGVIAGLVAQGLDLPVSARLGVCLHARAGDLAATAGERGTVAADLMPYLRTLVNE